MNYTIFQGSTSYIDAATLSSTFVMSNGAVKFTSSEVIEEEGKYKIVLADSMTSGFIPGEYTYQVINPSGLEDQGKVKVTPNLLYVDDVTSYWRKLIIAIDDVLAGRMTAGTASVHVGDKSLSYYTPDALIALRQWAQGQLDKEEKGFDPNDEHDIKYYWRLR